jgi:hypothetical protein
MLSSVAGFFGPAGGAFAPDFNVGNQILRGKPPDGR